MNIKQFIEKAIEGGWKISTSDRLYSIYLHGEDMIDIHTLNTGSIYLNPLAWEAVGKVEEYLETL